MLEDRNKTSHIYREEMAREVFGNLQRHLPHLNQLHEAFVTRVNEIELQMLELPPTSD